MNIQKGFTLIELLVVIAIIALLASIVLSSLSAASNKGYDGSVKEEMKQLLAQITIASGTVGPGINLSSLPAGISGTTCIGTGKNSTGAAVTFPSNSVFGDTNVQTILAGILKNAGSGTFHCAVDNTGKWAVEMTQLKSGGTWCVDNSGDVGALAVNLYPSTITGMCQ